MNVTNFTDIIDNITSTSSENPCPRQRNITRPLLFVHNHALFFFGSILNFLAFAILIKRSLRCHSTFAYLAFLSLSNGLLSLVHFSKWMFQYYFHLPFASFLITCRFHRFASDFLTHFSLFTLICVNIDRAHTVTKNRPNTKYAKSKFRTVLIRECFIASILFAFNFHWIIKYGYHAMDEDGNIFTLCSIDDNQERSIYNIFLTTIHPPLELIVFLCLPLLINIVCTIIIIRSLSIRMRTAKKFRPVKTSLNERSSQKFLAYLLPKTTKTSNIYSCLCCQIQCRRHTRLGLKISRNQQCLIKYDENNHSNEQQQKSISLSTDDINPSIARKTPNILDKKHRTRRTRDINLSAMLIGLNILYLLLNLPFNFHQTFVRHFHKKNSDVCTIMFISLLLDALQQTFFSTNFFLYVLTNRRFREEFYNTIIETLSHCRQKVSNKHSKASNPKYRSRTSSCNVSTTINHTNQNSDNQMMTIPINQNRDSTASDLEITETNLTQMTNENNKFLSKLVMFKDVSSSE